MKLANLKIGVRLSLLGAFFFVALAVVATSGELLSSYWPSRSQ